MALKPCKLASGASSIDCRRLLIGELPKHRSSNAYGLCGQKSARSAEILRDFQRDILYDISEFESFSIGAGWCQALSDCSVDPSFDVARRDPRFSSGSALWPSHDGIRRMRRTNLTIRPCRKTYGRHQDSKRTRLIHRPCGDMAQPGRRNSVFSYRYCAQLRHDVMSVTSVH